MTLCHQRDADDGKDRHDEWQCLKLTKHTLQRAEVGGGKMTVAYMVHALIASRVVGQSFGVDMEYGKHQHGHEYCQQYP